MWLDSLNSVDEKKFWANSVFSVFLIYIGKAQESCPLILDIKEMSDVPQYKGVLNLAGKMANPKLIFEPSDSALGKEFFGMLRAMPVRMPFSQYSPTRSIDDGMRSRGSF